MSYADFSFWLNFVFLLTPVASTSATSIPYDEIKNAVHEEMDSYFVRNPTDNPLHRHENH